MSKTIYRIVKDEQTTILEINEDGMEVKEVKGEEAILLLTECLSEFKRKKQIPCLFSLKELANSIGGVPDISDALLQE